MERVLSCWMPSYSARVRWDPYRRVSSSDDIPCSGVKPFSCFQRQCLRMAPQDVVKLASVPSTQAKELFIADCAVFRTDRVSKQRDLGSGFWNMEWRRTRLPAVGSYYSDGDILDAGGRRCFLRRTAPFFPDGWHRLSGGVRTLAAEAGPAVSGNSILIPSAPRFGFVFRT